MKNIILTRRIFLFSVFLLFLSTSVSIAGKIVLEDITVWSGLLDKFALWLSTSNFRLAILALITLISGLKLLDSKYINK